MAELSALVYEKRWFLCNQAVKTGVFGILFFAEHISDNEIHDKPVAFHARRLIIG